MLYVDHIMCYYMPIAYVVDLLHTLVHETIRKYKSSLVKPQHPAQCHSYDVAYSANRCTVHLLPRRQSKKAVQTSSQRIIKYEMTPEYMTRLFQ